MDVAILKQQGVTSYSHSLKKLDSEEQKIIEKKYQSKPLSQYTDLELLNQAAILLLKIQIIIGWPIPPDELKNILIGQLVEKMKEDYSALNIHEIEYAFRKNTQVQDWGKDMNLQLIDAVLLNYLEKRSEVSKIEESIKSKPVTQKLYTDEEIKNQRREEIETSFQAMKKGYYPLLHSYFESVLKEDGLLKEGETVGEFFVRKINNQVENIYKKES